MLRNFIFMSAVAAICMGAPTLAFAQDQKVLVTVNDQPITSFDVTQRINLWKLLGDRRGGDGIRKRALNELIDDIAATEEARKGGFQPTEQDVDAYMGDYAKGLKTDGPGLKQKLKSQRISEAAMRQYLAGRIAFNRLIRGKYKEDYSVSDEAIRKRTAQYKAEIDGKISSQIRILEADPRRRPITVYELMQITFPVDAPQGSVTPEMINSRAIEANGFIRRFKGCKSARAAASGIFNVKIGKRIEADGSKMDKRLKSALDKAGTGRAIGPIPSPTGVGAIALCGVRKIVPPKIQRPDNVKYPTPDQVRNVLVQEKSDQIAAKYAGKFRKGLYIEYRDPSYSQ
jgi:peptidyl-prolyl cis-trans isomerase SurA